jgi:acyl-coenzyme A synthetase/AMP-(fatty) acid ligase
MEGYGYPPAVAPRPDRRGWTATEDIGRIDPDGALRLLGRGDDCFKTDAGWLVSPGDITDALLSHPAVRDALVVPLAGRHGRLIGALVASPASAAALRGHVAERLPPWAQPHVLVTEPALPRLPGGKVDRLKAVRRLQAVVTARADP